MVKSSMRAWVGSGLLACVSVCQGVDAAVPADQFLPASTAGYIAIADPAGTEQRFNATDLGQLAADESMKPFADQIRKQLTKRLGNLEERLGITPQDLRGIASGEMAFAMIPQTEGAAVSVISVDTTGNAAARDALIEKVIAHLTQKGGKREDKTVGETTVTTFTMPATADRPARTATWFVRDEQLVVATKAAVAEQLLASLGSATDPLAKAAAFTYCMNQVTAEANAATIDLRWFIDPFAYSDAVRSVAKAEGREVAADDVDNIVRGQGFDAIQGVGGVVSIAADEQHDFIHRTAVYAPADKAATAGEKYRLAMRMLVLPNREGMTVEPWVPRAIASYTTVNVDLLNAFDHAASLFDAIAGYDGAFNKVIDRFENDPFGPRIKFRQQIIQSLGSRVSVMTDYTLPITPQSERFLAAIEVKPDQVAILREAIGKYVENDGYIAKTIDGKQAWEFQPEEEPVSSDSLLPGIDGTEEEADEDRILVRSAVSVTETHLLIASDVELLRQAFRIEVQKTESLVDGFDYQDVLKSLEQYGTSERSVWMFVRLDERMRPGYELLRQGKMPESETFAGRLLNDLLTSDEEDENRIVRKQRIDGSKLPNFEVTRRYFGPAGQTIRTDEDGWLVSGVVLAK